MTLNGHLFQWFGSIIATYHTLGRSILTQIGLSTGEMFLIDEMQMHSRVFTEIFVCVYMVIVLIIVTGICSSLVILATMS